MRTIYYIITKVFIYKKKTIIVFNKHQNGVACVFKNRKKPRLTFAYSFLEYQKLVRVSKVWSKSNE